MVRRVEFVLGLLLLGPLSFATPSSIDFIAPTGASMPLAHFEDGKLVGGIIKDLGEAIATRLGRSAHFSSIPPKRVNLVLTSGQSDGLCYAMPHWLDGDFNWSKPVVTDRAILIARTEAPPIHKIEDLAGKTIGMVMGYRYPDLEKVIGSNFQRDEAPSMELNFRKLEAERVPYAVGASLNYDYQRHLGAMQDSRVELTLERYDTMCAFSRLSHVSFDEVNRAIDQLIADGSVTAILSHYR
jgi:ABC-type amino acid transport substrate-binding protein